MNCKGLVGIGEYKMACLRVALSRLGRDLFHRNISMHENPRSKAGNKGIAHSALNTRTLSTSNETLNIESPAAIKTSASFTPSPRSVSMLLLWSAWSRVMTGGSAESAKNRSLEDLRTRRSL